MCAHGTVLIVEIEHKRKNDNIKCVHATVLVVENEHQRKNDDIKCVLMASC